MKNKKQHFVPRTYLKAWCDPNVPAKHEPYVWIFQRDSREGNPGLQPIYSMRSISTRILERMASVILALRVSWAELKRSSVRCA